MKPNIHTINNVNTLWSDRKWRQCAASFPLQKHKQMCYAIFTHINDIVYSHMFWTTSRLYTHKKTSHFRKTSKGFREVRLQTFQREASSYNKTKKKWAKNWRKKCKNIKDKSNEWKKYFLLHIFSSFQPSVHTRDPPHIWYCSGPPLLCRETAWG